jgi:uncharacterized Zn-finger protein
MKKRSPNNASLVMLTFQQNKANMFHQLHEGIKPFKCATCDASFTTITNLRKHNASIHEGN